MGKKTINDVDVQGKRVLVRVDFNVPRDKESGEITEDARIVAALPTICALRDQGARVILMSHLGRPKGAVVDALRLDKVALRLAQLLGQPVVKLDDCIGPEVTTAIEHMTDGDVVLLENVRFYPEEEQNDPQFAKALAVLGDLYVNDAFGTAHRAHASTCGVASYLPGVAGLLMKAEISALGSAIARPQRPFVAIIGGAKVSDKIGVIENLLDKVDGLLIGGGMANTFLAAQGHPTGMSLVEADKVPLAKELLAKATKMGKSLLIPSDVIVSTGLDDQAAAHVVAADQIPATEMALDIGPATIAAYQEAIKEAKTVIWNGPMGVFEVPAFAAGTNAVAQAVAESDANTIIGGGDSVAAIHQAGLADRIDHISTGGGASLEFLEGKILPGLAVLLENEKEA